MASQRPTLPYQGAAVYYPSLRYARRSLLFLSPVLLFSTAIGAGALLTSRPGEVDFVFGLILFSLGMLGLGCFGLLYMPGATWLRLGASGITYCVGFSRRDLSWDRLLELRLLSMDRTVFAEVVIEVVPMPQAAEPIRRRPRRSAWKIDANLFGWSPDALAQEMDGWRARYITARASV